MKKMEDNKIISLISDGFGNQLFQYALGYCLARRNNKKLYLDLNYFKFSTLRKYELNKLNIEENILPSDYCGNEIIYNEPCFEYNPEIFKCRGNIVLRGFWQSEKYFEEYADAIKKLYTFKTLDFIKNPHYLKLIKNSNSVAVHIRTGDYLEPPHDKVHFVCTKRYYNNAIRKIKEKLENPIFFIFSDNLKVAENFLPDNTNLIMVETSNWQEDFYYMQLVKHNIISNSTFAWWAAWLNGNPDKIIIAPNRWFTENTLLNYKDILPESWIKVQV